jgi:cation diffusion facilitator family transporter
MAAAAVPAENTAQALYRDTRRAALAGLIVALVLAFIKFLAGWLGHSLALVSDSVHSLGDSLSSASILIALWWAEHPADSEHPYGHTRIETIAASNVSLILVASGLWVGYEAVHRWDDRMPAPHWYTIAIALVSIVTSESIFRYSMAIGRRTGSKAVEASAWDQRLDVFSSLVVFLGLAIAMWLGPAWGFVDKIAALVIAGIIIWAGASLFWGSLQDLMDRQAEPEFLAKVRNLTLSVGGVRGVEKLLVRKSGLEYFVDIHVEVDPEISVHKGHEIGHAVKDRLVSSIAAVKDVLVHIEPFPHRDLVGG